MFFLFALILVAPLSGVFTSAPAVVVLSFDGFKPEYITEQDTPNMYNLRNIAARPSLMRSIFPTKTFVTHFSLSTGVYPNDHGVYGNTMFDNQGGKIFNTKEQFQSNEKIVPIWIENQKVGNGRHSGVMMWPGSEFDYGGITPTYMEKYDPEISWSDRANKIVNWMSATDQKANLVMAYFEDTQCYDKDEKEKKLKAHIKNVDDIIQKIYSGLNDANIQGDFDMIIMSDHGTKQVVGKNVMFIDDYVKDEDAQIIVSGPLVLIKSTNEEMHKSVYDNLFFNSDFIYKFIVYKSDELYKYWNTKIEILKNVSYLKWVTFLVALPDYTFYERKEYKKAKGNLDDNKFVIEENGYETSDHSMDAFFMGIGPKFKQNFLLDEHICLVDVYPLLKTLLELNTPVNDVQKNVDLNLNLKELLK